MIMSYDEYIKVVPKETTEFVNLVLKLFDNFIVNDRSIWPDDNIKIESKESKIFACLIFAKYYLGNNDRTKFILNGLEVKESFINFYDIKELEKTEIDYDYVFSKTSSVFMPFVYVEDYIYLTPERILYEYHKTFRDEIKLQNIFDKSPWHKMFEEDYSKYVLSKENDLMKPIELDFYKDLPYDLISYLNKTAQIFKFFEKYPSDRAYNHDIIKTYGDATIASLLLSVYYWEDNKILTFFENMGLSKKLCKQVLIPNYDFEIYNDITECSILIKYFKRYLDDGINKDIDKKDLTIEKIIGNIFDRNFTNSFVLETVLHKAGLSISDFDDFENKIKGFEKQYEHIEREQKIQKFFGNTPNRTIEFVEFVSKIHKIIEKNFKNGKCQKYITSENDISALSFFIGSYFVSNDFICYFKENSVTQGKVINSLGLNIKKEELEQIEVDIDLIINNYNDIVFGYTQTKEKVDINAVLFSLGNSQKIKSDSILKLVKDINPNLRISDNFTNFVIDYNKNQEEVRKYNLEQKFFGDMQKKSIEFIKRVSQTYQGLENSNKTVQFNADDLVQIAILYTAINFYTSDEIKFLENLKSASIADALNVYDNSRYTNSIPNYSESIDIIYSKFGKYIFGGKNKGKNKCDITIKDIYTNIFDKDNCSVVLCKFLDDIGFDYKKFINFDESFIEYKRQTMINNVEHSLENESKKYYFENLSQIYKCLLNMCKEEKLVYNINDNIEEIKNAARLLSILIREHEAIEKFLLLLSKKGIDLKNYLQYLNISFDDFNKYKMEEIDYLLIVEEFDEYNNYHDYSFFSGHEPGIISIIRDLFKEHDNGYLYEGFIKFLNQSPEIIAKEMETGEEVIIPLSKDEQINYFMSMPIDTIDYSLKSMSSFGRDLSEHSIMIANEFVNIAIMDNGNERVLNIQEEMNKLSRKPSIFAKKKSISEKLANNKAILDNLNDILKENEERMIEVIDHFGYLKKLIAAYIYRLNKYIEVLETSINNFENGIPINVNGLENIDNKSILQILRDKLTDYQNSLIISVGQYQKISLLLNTYFINLNKTTNARNTVIPNLYIELSIRDSIILERESIADLNSINDLLNNIVKANNQVLDKSTFQIRSNSEVPKELIESIKNELDGGNLITFNKDNMDDSLKQIIKK